MWQRQPGPEGFVWPRRRTFDKTIQLAIARFGGCIAWDTLRRIHAHCGALQVKGNDLHRVNIERYNETSQKEYSQTALQTQDTQSTTGHKNIEDNSQANASLKTDKEGAC